MSATERRDNLPDMPKGGARPGAGRKRSVGGDETHIITVKIGHPIHTDELRAICEERDLDNSAAIRWLIEQSAKRRAKRAGS